MIKFFCDCCEKEVPKESRTFVRVLDQDCDTPIGMKPEYLVCSDCKKDIVEILRGKTNAT